MLSPSLRIEVTKHIFQAALLENEVFDGKTEIVDTILLDLNACLYYPENEICRQGSIGKSKNINSFI